VSGNIHSRRYVTIENLTVKFGEEEVLCNLRLHTRWNNPLHTWQ